MITSLTLTHLIMITIPGVECYKQWRKKWLATEFSTDAHFHNLPRNETMDGAETNARIDKYVHSCFKKIKRLFHNTIVPWLCQPHFTAEKMYLRGGTNKTKPLFFAVIYKSQKGISAWLNLMNCLCLCERVWIPLFLQHYLLISFKLRYYYFSTPSEKIEHCSKH